MSSSQKDKILWKFNLQSKQKKYCFYAFWAPIHVVSKKQVVCILNITIWRLVTRRSKCLEQPIKLLHLAVNITENFDRQPYLHIGIITLTKVGS
jgi:hypothetical protein